MSSVEMVEEGEDVASDLASPVTSGDWKRILSPGAGYDDYAKRRLTDDYSTMSLPVGQASTSFSSPSSSSYGGVPASSYPVSSLYYSPQRDEENEYHRSYCRQSRLVERTPQRSSAHRHLSDSNVGHDRLTEGLTTERYCFRSSVASYPEQGYPGQHHFHEYPCPQEADVGMRSDQVNPSFQFPLNKRNTFNLSRYQLDDDAEFATVADQFEDVQDMKPNRFKTQRERSLEVRSEESEESESTAQELEETVRSHGGQDSSSLDSTMSQRERLRKFRFEHSHNVVIPNQWEGEKNLPEFVAFGNIEAALRPLGFMMARAALVNDSVTSRDFRSSSSGP